MTRSTLATRSGDDDFTRLWCGSGALVAGAAGLVEGHEGVIVLRDRRVYVGTVRRQSNDAVVLRLLGGPSLWFSHDEVSGSSALGPRTIEQERLIALRQGRGLPALVCES